MAAEPADRLGEGDGELGGAGRVLQDEQDRGPGAAEQPVKRLRLPAMAAGRVFPERRHPPGGVGDGGRPRRVQADGDAGPDEHRRDEQQAAAAELGVVLGAELGALDVPVVPLQARAEVGQRGPPAPGGQLPRAVHDITLEQGAQRGPFGLDQRLPGDREHVGGVRGDLVAVQDRAHPRAGGGVAAQHLGDLALRLGGIGLPDPVEQVADGGRHRVGDGRQEVDAVSLAVQGADDRDIRLARQLLVAGAAAGQPGLERRDNPAAACGRGGFGRGGFGRGGFGQAAQRAGQLPQRGDREPAHGQVGVAHTDTQHG